MMKSFKSAIINMAALICLSSAPQVMGEVPNPATDYTDCFSCAAGGSSVRMCTPEGMTNDNVICCQSNSSASKSFCDPDVEANKCMKQSITTLTMSKAELFKKCPSNTMEKCGG